MIFRKWVILSFVGVFLGVGSFAQASTLDDVEFAYKSGQYFSSARMAFNEAIHAQGSTKALYYAWTTLGLVKAGLDQSASYFFIRTLQFQDRAATKRVLEVAPLLIERIGPDLLRRSLDQFTHAEDYSNYSYSAFAVVQAKQKLLTGDYPGVIELLQKVPSNHPLYPTALQIRASAYAMSERPQDALRDFKACADHAGQRKDDPELKISNPSASLERWVKLKKDAARDLEARCIAGQARVLYELGQYEDSDRKYDEIPKASMVWTDTLFEHAWATFQKEEYNRTLGKLVSYQSPGLKFVFNSEIEVLRAQSYLALCLYDDASQVIDEFNRRYGGVAKEIKLFVESNGTRTDPYYQIGREAALASLHSERPMNQFLNRFVRAPYFEALVISEDRAQSEKIAIQRIDQSRTETATGLNSGFPGFLSRVLDWRVRTIHELGGIYVRNSILDYHQVLIADFEKMQFMKIDLLGHQKEQLLEPEKALNAERSRGNRVPVRRNDQMLFIFNGEFWNDEIGDYVFALESACAK